MTRKTLFIFFSLSFSLTAYATHIAGGDLFYRCLGSNNYEITLKLYRDCINGQAPYDNPASIGVFRTNGSLVENLLVSFPGSRILPVTLNSPCVNPPTNVCVEEAVYTYTVNLPPVPGGYNLSYQRCCRNGSILNLVEPDSTGATYTTKIPDASIAPCNSAPGFTNFPPIFLCANVPFSFDHSATDPDGDVLVYDFFDPLDGARFGSPGYPMPSPPAPPPYGFVSFLPPYSGSNPMSSVPSMTINPNTGLITGTPNRMGQWVVGVRVREYRSGVLLGENKRDFQFNVTSCSNIVVSSFPSQQTFCFGFKADFSNNSINAQTYHWDFGVSSLTNDTSNQVTPSYTYAESGTYTVTLIANPGSICADTAFSVLKIEPLLDPSFNSPPPQCRKGNGFNFTAGGNFAGSPTSSFSWMFGSNATPQNSTAQDPTGIVYNTSGIFTASLTISENNCIKTYTNTVQINPSPTVNTAPVSSTICSGYSTSFTASGANTYQWSPIPGLYSATGTVITVTGIVSENYTVTGTNLSGCSDSAVIALIVLPAPTVNCANAAICKGSSTLLSAFASGGGVVSYSWMPPSGLNQVTGSYVTASPDTTTGYSIVGMDTNGCTDTINITVQVNPLPTIDVGPDISLCLGFTAPLNASGALTYVWHPALALNISTGPGVQTTPSVDMTYTVTGTDANGCTDQDIVSASPGDSLFASAGADVTLCEGSETQLFGSGGVFYTWNPAQGLNNATIHNPVANPAMTTNYTLTIFGGYCPTLTDSIKITINPLPDISAEPSNTTICSGTAITFSVTSASGEEQANYYEWNPATGLDCTGCRNPTATPTTSINYALEASFVRGCNSFDTIRIVVKPAPVSHFTIVPGECDVAFINSSSGGRIYQWNFGDGNINASESPTHTYAYPGTYTVTLMVTNSYDCSDVLLSTPFYANGKEHGFIVPNVFTPNADNTNDGFIIRYKNMTDISCKIFNKWGLLVYELFLPDQVWDGRLYSGVEAPEGIYYYVLNTKGACDGIPYEEKGAITLLRY